MIDWRPLTRMALKAELYEREQWFREGLAAASAILDEGLADVIRRVALVLVKPDGLIAGRASTLLGYLDQHGFSLAAAEKLLLDRFHWREMWRYQLTSATLDRLAINDLVLRGPALLLLLRHRDGIDVPASVYLSGLKGPSTLALQPPDCLRRALRQPNRIFSFFHAADEPADVLRELAILADDALRIRLLTALESGSTDPADRALVAETVAASDRHARSLDAAEALQRVDNAIRGIGASDDANRVRDDIARMRAGERIEWRPFARALQASGVEVDPWDVAALGAEFIVYDEPGYPKLIQPVDTALWRGEAQPS